VRCAVLAQVRELRQLMGKSSRVHVCERVTSWPIICRPAHMRTALPERQCKMATKRCLQPSPGLTVKAETGHQFGGGSRIRWSGSAMRM